MQPAVRKSACRDLARSARLPGARSDAGCREAPCSRGVGGASKSRAQSSVLACQSPGQPWAPEGRGSLAVKGQRAPLTPGRPLSSSPCCAVVLLPAGRGWGGLATWAWEPPSLLGPEGLVEAGLQPLHVPVQRLPPAGHLGTGRSSGGRVGPMAEHHGRKDWEASVPGSQGGCACGEAPGGRADAPAATGCLLLPVCKVTTTASWAPRRPPTPLVGPLPLRHDEDKELLGG